MEKKETLLEFVENLRHLSDDKQDIEVLADVRGDHCLELIKEAKNHQEALMACRRFLLAWIPDKVCPMRQQFAKMLREINEALGELE